MRCRKKCTKRNRLLLLSYQLNESNGLSIYSGNFSAIGSSFFSQWSEENRKNRTNGRCHVYRYGISWHCLQFHFLLHSSFYTSTMYMQSNQIDYVLFHTYLMLIAAIHGIIISFFIPFHFIKIKQSDRFPWPNERWEGGRSFVHALLFCNKTSPRKEQ